MAQTPATDTAPEPALAMVTGAPERDPRGRGMSIGGRFDLFEISQAPRTSAGIQPAALDIADAAVEARLARLSPAERRDFDEAYAELLESIASWDGSDIDTAAFTACGRRIRLANPGVRRCFADLTAIGYEVSLGAVYGAAGQASERWVSGPVVVFEDPSVPGFPRVPLSKLRLDEFAALRARMADQRGRQRPPLPFTIFLDLTARDGPDFRVVNVLTMGGNAPREDGDLTAKIRERRIEDGIARIAAAERERYVDAARGLSPEEDRAWSEAFASLLTGGEAPVPEACRALGEDERGWDACRAAVTMFRLPQPGNIVDHDDAGTIQRSGYGGVTMTLPLRGEAVTVFRSEGHVAARSLGIDPRYAYTNLVVAEMRGGRYAFSTESIRVAPQPPEPPRATLPVAQLAENLTSLYDALQESFGIDLALREGERFNFVIEQDLLFCRRATGDLMLVPSGFITDLASVQNWLRTIFLLEQSPKEMPGAILHDWLYAISRREDPDDHLYADTLFREELEDAGAGWLTQRFFPLGTRIGGRSAVGRPAELRFATRESCARGRDFSGVPQNAIVGRIGEDRQPGDKCAAFLDRYDDLLAEHGRAERLDTSIIVNNEERARYFEAVVGNDDPDKTCPLPR